MSKYRVLVYSFALAACLCLTAGQAAAWELMMKGNFDWEFRALGQQGPNGFFGHYDVAGQDGVATAASAPVGTFAPYNFWAGWNRRAGIVSGSDASWATQYMDVFIDLKFNNALQVRGYYHIGEWAQALGSTTMTTGVPTTVSPVLGSPFAFTDLGVGDLVDSEYQTMRASGVRRSFSPGYWNYLFLTANTPWGILNFGKRRSAFGLGLFYNGEDSRSTETVSLSTIYGPLNITLGFYPSRRGTTSASTTSGTFLGGFFNRDRDKNNVRAYDGGPTVVYRSGPMEAGVTVNWGAHYHTGGEGVIAAPATRITAYCYLDNHAEFYGGSFVKYNNGRFFFNAEGYFYQIMEKTHGHVPGTTPGSNGLIGRGSVAGVGIRNVSVEHQRYALEMGGYSGPAKLSLLYAWLSGGDRRGLADGAGGFYIGQIDKTGIVRSSTTSNTGFFRPYSYLINEVYGTGVFQNPDTTKGYIEDAIIYAGRLDYAVAANLNLSASFMWADRATKSGFGWGCLRPDVIRAGGAGTALLGAANIGQINNTNIFLVNNNANTPNIPDMNLGYEIDAGMNWKLLEGLTLSTTFAWWQPGKWFNWACVDKALDGWAAAPPAATGWPAGGASPLTVGVNPNRSIDPVWALELIVEGQF